MTDADMPIVCNGFKDASSSKWPCWLKNSVADDSRVEKATELDLVLKYADKVGVRPQIGMRIKLAARVRDVGNFFRRLSFQIWTYGQRDFAVFEKLRKRDMSDCLSFSISTWEAKSLTFAFERSHYRGCKSLL